MGCPKLSKTQLIIVGVVGAVLLILIIFLIVYFTIMGEESGSDEISSKGGDHSHTKTGVGGSGNTENSIEGTVEEFQKWTLETHNEYRVKHHAEPLKMTKRLNEMAAKCAKYYIDNGQVDHSCPYKNEIDGVNAGENLNIAQLLPADFKDDPNRNDQYVAKEALKAFYAEADEYDYENGSPGGLRGGRVGHFTQMVWQNSKELGVAMARGSEFGVLVCLYYPNGNILGQYVNNVRRP